LKTLKAPKHIPINIKYTIASSQLKIIIAIKEIIASNKAMIGKSG
jgi:hypothetical protein